MPSSALRKIAQGIVDRMKHLIISELPTGHAKRFTLNSAADVVPSTLSFRGTAMAIIQLEDMSKWGYGTVWRNHTFDEPYRDGWKRFAYEFLFPDGMWSLALDYDRYGNESVALSRLDGRSEWDWPDPLESHARTLVMFSASKHSSLATTLESCLLSGWPVTSNIEFILNRNSENDWEFVPDDAETLMCSFGEQLVNSFLISGNLSPSLDDVDRYLGIAFPELQVSVVGANTFKKLDGGFLECNFQDLQ